MATARRCPATIIPPGLAFWGVVAGIVAGMTAFMTARMTFGTALAYVLIIYACTLSTRVSAPRQGCPSPTASRVRRCATILFLRPTPNGLTTPSAIRAETVFTVFQVFGRMTFGQLAAFQMEGIRIAQRAHLGRMSLVVAIVIGLLGGLTLAYAIHLVDAYNYGWNIIDGGSTQGGYRTAQALKEYARLESRIDPGEPLKPDTSIARAVGLALSLLMFWLRLVFLRFPLNPVGLALAGTFGAPICSRSSWRGSKS